MKIVPEDLQEVIKSQNYIDCNKNLSLVGVSKVSSVEDQCYIINFIDIAKSYLLVLSNLFMWAVMGVSSLL